LPFFANKKNADDDADQSQRDATHSAVRAIAKAQTPKRGGDANAGSSHQKW